MSWQAARSGLPGDTGAVNGSAQVNQFLTSHGVTPVYEGNRVWSVPSTSGTSYTVFYWLDGSHAAGHGYLPAEDVDQPFTMPAGVTAIGRVTLPVQAAGSGAGLQVTLYPDDGSGNPDTASPLASAYVPSSHLTATSAVTGLPGGPLATARHNTVFGGLSYIYGWAQTAVTAAGAGNFATPVTDGNWTLFIGGTDNSGSSAIANVTAVAYEGSGKVSTGTPQPPLPQAATTLSACVCGGTVIAAGGFAGSTAYDSVWAASWAAGTGTVGSWSAQAALPVATVGGLMASWGAGTVYVIGGVQSAAAGTPYTDAVWVGTVSNGQVTGWTAGPPLPAARKGGFAAVIGNWLVVAGGRDEAGNVYGDTWYSAVNADGTLAGWQTGPDLPQPACNVIPGWNQVTAGQVLVIVSGEANTSTLATSTYNQALTVTADGPAPAWETQNWPSILGEFQCAAYQSGNAGDYYIVGYHLTDYESGPLYPVPLASVPLPVSGLTPGSTYHLLVHQDGGDDANYLETAELSSGSGAQWLYRARGTSGAWSAHTGYEIAVEIYDQTPGGPPLHLAEDSGARVTTLVYSGAPGQLLGVMESTEFASGSPETALPSVTEVTWSDGLPSGLTVLT